MKSIGFYLRKGGVGKTTISVHFSHLLSKLGYKVCLVDCDSQGNASTWLCESANEELATYLEGKAKLEDCLVKVRENFSILPTIGGKGGTLKEFSETRLNDRIYAFEILNKELTQMEFDFVVYDMSPSFGILEKRLIKALDEVIVVTQAEGFSLDGVHIFRDHLEEVQKNMMSTVKADKIVINMVNNSYNIHKLYKQDLLEIGEKLHYKILEIPQETRVKECQIKRKTLFDEEEGGKLADGLEELVKIVLEEVCP